MKLFGCSWIHAGSVYLPFFFFSFNNLEVLQVVWKWLSQFFITVDLVFAAEKWQKHCQNLYNPFKFIFMWVCYDLALSVWHLPLWFCCGLDGTKIQSWKRTCTKVWERGKLGLRSHPLCLEMGLNLERDELQALRERETILQPGKVMTFLFVLKEAGSVWTFISYWCAEGSSDSS